MPFWAHLRDALLGWRYGPSTSRIFPVQWGILAIPRRLPCPARRWIEAKARKQHRRRAELGRPGIRAGQDVERLTGIEPAWPAWKAGALPLSYTRETA